MGKEEIKNKIEELLDNYELVKEIVIRMDAKHIKINYEDWFHNYPIGLNISKLDFDSDDIKIIKTIIIHRKLILIQTL